MTKLTESLLAGRTQIAPDQVRPWSMSKPVIYEMAPDGAIYANTMGDPATDFSSGMVQFSPDVKAGQLFVDGKPNTAQARILRDIAILVSGGPGSEPLRMVRGKGT